MKKSFLSPQTINWITTILFSIVLFNYSLGKSINNIVLKANEMGLKLIQSDSEKIVLEYKQETGTKNPSSNPFIYLAVFPTGSITPKITEYTFQIPAADGKPLREINSKDSNAPLLSPQETKEIVSLTPFGFIRDYRIFKCALSLNRTIQLQNNEKVPGRYSSLRIEIPNQNSDETFIYTPGRKKGIGLEKVLSDLVFNYDNAETLRGKPSLTDIKDASDYPGLPSSDFYAVDKPWIKVSLTERGIYQITYSDLMKTGASPDSMNPETIKLYSLGKEVPLLIVTRLKNQFQAGDVILFYADPVQNIYTHTGVYWLTWGGEAGIRIPRIDPALPHGNPGSGEYCEKIFLEEKHIPEDYISIPGGDKWFWETLYSGVPDSHIITIPGVNSFSQDSVQLKIRLYGKSDKNHRVLVTFNRESVGELNWTGQSYHEFIEPVPLSLLREGENLLQLTLLSPADNSVDTIDLKSMELDYPRKIELANNFMEFTIQDLPSSDSISRISFPISENRGYIPVILEIYSQNSVVLIKPPINETTQKYTLDLDSTHPYYIGTVSGLKSAKVQAVTKPNNLRSTDQQADVIYITHPDFLPAVQKLAEYRKKEGYSTRIVNIYDIYDQFSYGEFDPRAIKSFIQYCFYYWKSPSPNYVVLVGDSNWDYMDYQETGTKVFVPSYRRPNQILVDQDGGSPEDYYVDICGKDSFPDLVLGRISVQTLKDAEDVVEKTIAQETDSDLGPWRTDAIIAVDDGFESDGHQAAQDYLPLWMKPDFLFQQKYIYVDHQKFGKSSHRKQSPDATSALIEKMNHGSPFVLYIGHGGGGVWAHERLFLGGGGVKTSDTYRLRNLHRNMFIYTMSCLNGFFDYPNPPWQTILAEELIRYLDRGAIALFSPTGKGGTSQHLELGKGMAQAFFKDDIRTIGDAVYQGKVEYLLKTMDVGLADQYIILGDPLAQIALPKKVISVDASPEFMEPEKPVNLEITGKTGSELTDGLVTLQVYKNKTEMISEKANIPFSNGKFDIPLQLPEQDDDLVVRAYVWNTTTRMDGAGAVEVPLQRRDFEYKFNSISTDTENRINLTVKNLFPESIQSPEILISVNSKNQTKQGFSAKNRKPWDSQEEKSLSYQTKVSPGVYQTEIKISGKAGNQVLNNSTSFIYMVNDYQGNGYAVSDLDLTVSSNEISPGDQVLFKVPVYNYGNSTVNNIPCVIQIENDLSTTVLIPEIAPHVSYPFQYTWPVPIGFLSGKSEIKTNFNMKVGNQYTLQRELVIRKAADLTISPSDIKYTPLKPQDGETIFFDITIHNRGGWPARNVSAQVYNGDPEKGAGEISNVAMYGFPTIPLINPGESKVLRLRWDPPMNTYGEETMYVYVDRNKYIRDADRANQEVVMTLKINKSADLVVTPEDITWRPEKPVAGDTVLISAVIHNIGETDAQTVDPWGENQSHAFDVKFDIRKTNPSGDFPLGETTYIPFLPAGQSTTVQKSLVATPDITAIIVKVDADNEVLEMEENKNNRAEKPIHIEPR